MFDTTPITAPPKRHWHQFSLRTLFVVVTLLAIPCAYVGWQAKIVVKRKVMIEKIVEGGGAFSYFVPPIPPANYAPPESVPWCRHLLGDCEVWIIAPPASMEDDQAYAIKEMFPEAKVQGID
ncbi:MAG TPA: hypothetical protein VFE24_15130 [Pirellulales bacterium]|jgi:hypothetical protein|nr:hypothetical protein [Pirellulales bacterium]